MVECASCTCLNPEGARFCNNCGTPVELTGGTGHTAGLRPSAERRVTSVLFADIVGFTPLSERRDPEEVRELLSKYFAECRVVVDGYGGTVEKFIGDAVMAVWGVPLAHEDDAERAVRAGLDLVRAIEALGERVGAPGLAVRVGIVTGEVAVTVGAIGEGMVAGDAVNTAARVQSQASPGQVWVDSATRSLAARSVSFADAGQHEAKGKSMRLQLWRATGVLAPTFTGERQDGLQSPMVGRVEELRVLTDHFSDTCDTRRSRIVVIEGEPGIGKSHLSREFERRADSLPISFAWHRGRCPSYGEGVTFAPLAEAVRARLGLLETDSLEWARGQLESGLSRYLPRAAERALVRPSLEALLGLDVSRSLPEDELFRAWALFLGRAGSGRVVVFLIEDAHLAHDSFLNFVSYLLGSSEFPFLIVMLARRELLARRPTFLGPTTATLRLGALGPESMGRLLDGLVAGLPVDVRTALISRSEGVPLFAVETVRALADRKVIVERGGRFVAIETVNDALRELGSPASLQALMAARLDSLNIYERHVVAAASVLGHTFSHGSIAALASSGADLESTLGSLRRKDILLIESDRSTPEFGQYSFVQELIRQVAYSTQSRRDRKARHIAAARYLEASPAPGNVFDLRVVRHLIDAFDSSSTGDADSAELMTRAAAHLTHALGRSRAFDTTREDMRLVDDVIDRVDDPREVTTLRALAAATAPGTR